MHIEATLHRFRRVLKKRVTMKFGEKSGSGGNRKDRGVTGGEEIVGWTGSKKMDIIKTQ